MSPENDGSDGNDSGGSTYVHCPDCGSRASADWSFCRSCEASLDDAAPADRSLVVRRGGEDLDLSEYVGDPTGCDKCGHTDPAVGEIAVTGEGFPEVLEVQNRRFRAVSCPRCGYTEFYAGLGRDQASELFLR